MVEIEAEPQTAQPTCRVIAASEGTLSPDEATKPPRSRPCWSHGTGAIETVKWIGKLDRCVVRVERYLFRYRQNGL
jgi:hypothetical protein